MNVIPNRVLDFRDVRPDAKTLFGGVFRFAKLKLNRQRFIGDVSKVAARQLCCEFMTDHINSKIGLATFATSPRQERGCATKSPPHGPATSGPSGDVRQVEDAAVHQVGKTSDAGRMLHNAASSVSVLNGFAT